MQRKWSWGLALAPCVLAGQLGLTRQAVANDNVTMSTSLTSVAQSGTVNLLDLGAGDRPGLVSQETVRFGSDSSAGSISYSGTSGIYMGNVAGITAAPWTPTGIESRNYFATQPGGAITINYAQNQQYFGIMWGSVDSYNTLSFYNGSRLVDSVSGRDVTLNPNGSQAATGTYFANFNFNGDTGFNRVVFSSSLPAFEFNMIAYSTQTQAITPTDLAKLGPQTGPQTVSVPVNAAPVAGSPLLLGLLGLWRRRRAKAAG
ncbi:MAG: hypothetical protein K5Q68_09795 [Roseococcus sp.]|nr:hypothetical protein [Roseococcus sp.]